MRKCIVMSGAMIAALLGVLASPAAAAERIARPAKLLPAYEIVTIVRSAGLNPISQPSRKGMNYLLRAVDDEGQAVRVVVDGRAGHVVSVTPIAYRGRELEPFRPSVYDSGPPGYEGDTPVYRAAPPIVIEEAPEPPVFRRAAPTVPPGMIPQPVEREAAIVPPSSTPQVVTAPPALPPDVVVAPTENGEELLPPPPPRFQQRVNATPNAKPASKPPKSAAKPSAKTDSAKIEPAKPNVSSSATQPDAPANGKLSPLY